MTGIGRPDATEYAPYYGEYVAEITEHDVLDLLDRQIGETVALLRTVPPEKGTYRYAPGKWSINEVVGHLCDTERVFAYRALRFSRNDPQALPGFEQDDYVADANFDERELPNLIDELHGVRLATVSLFRSMSPEMLLRRGVASGVEFSVRAIPWVIAGHERHHVRVLDERYR